MTRITDSPLYAHLWGTDELRQVFDDRGRLIRWLQVLTALARAQAKNGIVPDSAAEEIGKLRPEELDVEEMAKVTRRTSHSTLGFISVVEAVLSEGSARWVYYGSTVQDVTDTATVLAMRETGAVLWRDLRAIEAALVELARRHRDVVMAGRTHGQIGSPITFGWKAASWADEMRRHLERLDEGRKRWLVGQLAGSVGTIGFLGDLGMAVRRDFCSELGLRDPGISWTTSRDRFAEFVQVLALITTSLARIGEEVYELQRSEIREVSESTSASTVGSITMPHKRNPEGAEHLVTLGRLLRSSAQATLESAVQVHERDARGWKTEWVALPEACLLAGTAARVGRGLVEGIDVDPTAMEANLAATDGYWASEALLARLAPLLGKHEAQRILQEALGRGRTRGATFADAIRNSPAVVEALSEIELDSIASIPDLASAGAMTDETIARIEALREDDSESWM